MGWASGRGPTPRSACWRPRDTQSGRPPASPDIHQFIISPIEAHSKKPDETRDKIVALMGDLPRVELFARQTSPGWDVWGNEVEPTIPDFGTNCPKLEVTD